MTGKGHEAGVTVKVGTKFRMAYADGNPLWRVVKARGDGTWDCEVDAKEPDWAGTRKVFGSEEIARSISMARLFEGLRSESKDFWSSQRPGAILHYHDSFGRYVRGVVVEVEASHGTKSHALKPTALVGAWDAYDLPGWNDAGFCRSGGYHVEKITKGEPWRPNPSNIFESPSFGRPMGPASGIDPTQLEPIDLTLPEPTPQQAEAARLLEVIEKIREAIKLEGGADDYAAEYRRRIAEVSRIVSDVELEPGGPAGPRF